MGQGRLPISSVRIEKMTNVRRFSWSMKMISKERFLEPDDFEIVDLEWTPVDANPDQARLIVVLGGGEETSIALERLISTHT